MWNNTSNDSFERIQCDRIKGNWSIDDMIFFLLLRHFRIFAKFPNLPFSVARQDNRKSFCAEMVCYFKYWRLQLTGCERDSLSALTNLCRYWPNCDCCVFRFCFRAMCIWCIYIYTVPGRIIMGTVPFKIRLVKSCKVRVNSRINTSKIRLSIFFINFQEIMPFEMLIWNMYFGFFESIVGERLETTHRR